MSDESTYFKEEKGEHSDISSALIQHPVEYADDCYKCQQRHFQTKGFEDNKFPVICKGIPKRLIDEKYFPLEEVYGEAYESLTEAQKIQLQYKNNKIAWAKDMLNWSPYNPKREEWQGYQETMLCCTALRKAARLGRRMGKSEVIVVDALHYGMNTLIRNPRILILAPFMNLCDELHVRAIEKLDNSVYAGTYSSTKKPYVIEIPRPQYGDSVKIKLFTTGSASGGGGNSTRGQAADKLFIDEAGYQSQEALEAVIPLLLEHPEVEILVTSTPSQVPNKFKEWCLTDCEWKDFWYPYTIMGNFKDEEKMLRKMYTQKGWMQEIEAEFYEGSSKVFKESDIKASLALYKYPHSAMEIPNAEDWEFYMGVDWNSWKNGTQIAVHGINRKTKKTKLWYRWSVNENSEKKFSDKIQTESIMQIRDIDRRFGCKKIGVDVGYGATQIEILIKMYQDIGQDEKIVPVDFASNVTEKHPMTGESFNRRIKGVMIYLLQQRFEYGTIEISGIEEGDLRGDDQLGELLTTQLNHYEIEKYDSRDNPVFRSSMPDHLLDAAMIANYMISKYAEQVFELGVSKRAISGNAGDAGSTPEEKAQNSITNFVNNVNRNGGIEKGKKFKNSELRDNIMPAYDEKSYDEEVKAKSTAAKGRLGGKVFGSSKRRVNRRGFM